MAWKACVRCALRVMRHPRCRPEAEKSLAKPYSTCTRLGEMMPSRGRARMEVKGVASGVVGKMVRA